MIRILIVSCLLFSPLVSNAYSSAHKIEQILAEMTLEQKIGQLMMVGFGGREMSPKIARFLTSYHIGAVTLYSRNIVNTSQLTRLVTGIRQAMAEEIQPFVAVDQEGGNVVRVRADVTVLPGAMTLIMAKSAC